MKIRLISVIWGEAFVDLFCKLGARTLLAAGNIPELVKRQDVIYNIYTTPEDADLLKASPVFQKLKNVVDVQFTIFNLAEIDGDHFGSHNDLWLRGIEIAKRNDETVFFLMPDIIYADGTLARWLKRV
jgi:hypothetical protein